MAEDDLETVAERIAAHFDDELPEEPRPKLPQARLYLRAARWGFDEMVQHRRDGSGFVFHIIGILTLLRSVPFALNNRDRKISPTHEKVIGEWWARTPLTTPVLLFLKRARDLAQKEAALNSIAVSSESGIGEGSNYTVTSRDYEVELVEAEQRHDLLAELRKAFEWLEAELAQIEARLPDRTA